jgi:signal peptide peptidase SppA
MLRNTQFTVPSFARVHDYSGAWAIEPSAANALLGVATRMDWTSHVQSSPVAELRSAIELIPVDPATPDGQQVAVIRLGGLLMKQVSSMTNGTSTVQARRDIRTAARDSKVSAILLVVDSPGGTVSGTGDLAADVLAASKQKPTWTFIEDLCASAAFYVASQSEKIYANSRSALVGSIGTMLTLYDLSRQAAANGVEAVVFATGPNKAIGTPGTPITAEQRSTVQSMVDQMQRDFDTAVQSGRRLSAEQLAAVRTGQVWPADQAQSLGLIDGIQSLDSTLTALVATAAKTNSGNRKPPSQQGIAVMTFSQFLASRGWASEQQCPQVYLNAYRAEYERLFPTASLVHAGVGAIGQTHALPSIVPATMTQQEVPNYNYAATYTATHAAVPPQQVPTGQQPAVQATPSPAATPANVNSQQQSHDPIAVMRAQAAAEHDRIQAVTAALAQYPSAQRLTAQAIREGWTVDRARGEAAQAELASIRGGYAGNTITPNTQGGAVISRPSVADQSEASVIESAMLMSAGCSEQFTASQLPATERERVMNLARSAEFRNWGLHAVMAAVIRMSGRTFHGNYKSTEFVEAACNASRLLSGGMQSAGFSTISLPGILGNVARKTLLNTYERQETVWQMICAKRNHTDFKPHSRYRLDVSGAMKRVGPTGELKSVGLTEAGYTNRLGTFGLKLALNRQMMIDDDMGAFLELPRMLGQECAVRVEEAVMVLVLSNAGSFFATGNRNLISGGGSALAIAGLTAAEQKFADQVNTNGKPILHTPDRVLVPTPLWVTAKSLYDQTKIEITGSSDRTVTADNPHATKFKPVKSPYLNNTAIKDQDGAALSGQSDTAWYMFADPAVRAAIGIAFLNGQETPSMREGEMPMGSLGYQWDLWHDFGVAFEDPAGALKSAGA